MVIVYLGDTTEYLQKVAQDYDSKARLVTENNFQDLPPGSYYTSIGDLGSLYNLGLLLQQADKIIYVPPLNDQWSGGKEMKYWTEDYLKVFSFIKPVENYNMPGQSLILDRLADQRIHNSPQLWISGCSVSHGKGVSKEERYGTLLAKRLNLPVSFLTCPGSSIIWAADQILRSDIRKNDTVILGLTSHQRIPYYHDQRLIHVNSGCYLRDSNLKNIVSLDILTSENSFYQTLSSVFQVINFCKQLKVNLVIASLLDNDIVYYIKNFPKLTVISNIWGRENQNRFLDFGSDAEHPGPKTHQYYANKIYQKIVEK